MTLSLLAFRMNFNLLNGFVFLTPHKEVFRLSYSPELWKSASLTLKTFLNNAELKLDS